MSLIRPAPIRLADLAEEMRPDWLRPQFESALDAARNARWSWDQTFAAATALMRSEKATPADLVVMTRNPLRKTPPSNPTAEYRERRDAMGRRPA